MKSRISGLFYLLRLKKKERGGEREREEKNIFRVYLPRVSSLEKCRQSDRLSGCNRGGVKALIYGTAPLLVSTRKRKKLL